MSEPSFIKQLELILDRIEGAASDEQIDKAWEEAYQVAQQERANIRARKEAQRQGS